VWLQDKIRFVKADVSDYMKEAVKEVGVSMDGQCKSGTRTWICSMPIAVVSYFPYPLCGSYLHLLCTHWLHFPHCSAERDKTPAVGHHVA
jgi:hypothetical protein